MIWVSSADHRVKSVSAEAATLSVRYAEHRNPALMAEESASQLEKQSVRRREHSGDRDMRRMTDVRFEQLRQEAPEVAASMKHRFTQLSAKKDDIEVPQFTFSSTHVLDQA